MQVAEDRRCRQSAVKEKHRRVIMACGIARNAIAVYSAWLCEVS
jgi:hypothetical protein